MRLVRGKRRDRVVQNFNDLHWPHICIWEAQSLGSCSLTSVLKLPACSGRKFHRERLLLRRHAKGAVTQMATRSRRLKSVWPAFETSLWFRNTLTAILSGIHHHISGLFLVSNLLALESVCFWEVGPKFTLAYACHFRRGKRKPQKRAVSEVSNFGVSKNAHFSGVINFYGISC